MGIFSTKKKPVAVATPPSAADQLAGQIGVEGQRSAADDAAAAASRATYQTKLAGYDPAAYAATAGAASADRAAQTLTTAQEQRDTLNNRRGVLGSPTGSSVIQRSIGTELGRTLGEGSLQSAGLQLSAIGQGGQLAASDRAQANTSRGAQLDLMTGQRDYQTAQANAEAERAAAAKKSKYGLFGKIAGGVAGTLLGPLGTSLGAKIGEWGASKL